MTSIQNHHLVTHTSSGANLDNNIDALLDDLQAGVGSRGDLIPHHSSLVNGGTVNLPPGASGYRETTTTVTRERNGVPMTSRDYQIEYLNPANTVTVLSERGASPNPDAFSRDSPQVSSLKKSSYEYKYSSSSSDGRGNMQPVDGYSINKSETVREGNKHLDGTLNRLESSSLTSGNRLEGSNLNRNLNELDSLLYELNTAQRTPNPPRRAEHTSRSTESRIQREYQQSSTPRSASLTRDAQREFQQYNSEPPATPKTQHREYQQYSSETPGTPRAPQRGVNVNREVTSIEHRTHTSRRDSPGPGSRDRSMELSPTLRRRTPSPSGEFRPVNFHSYPHSPHETRSRSQTRWEESSSSQTQQTHQTDSKYRTNYVNHASTARTEESQPYRSPSPVSFPQRRSPSPVRRAVSRSDSGRTLTYQVSPNQHQPQPPLSDPSSPTVITYKYSSHSSQHSKYPGESQGNPAYGNGPRPFPTPTPIPDPGDQSPPKKLDDLMASFQDNKRTYTTTEQYYREEENRRHHNAELQRSPSFERNIRPSSVKATQIYQTPQERVPAQAPVHEMVPPPSPPPQNKQQQQLSRSVAGPPVYYPPGVELFAKKEEALMEQESAGGKGKMKGKAKMKYKYEASEKSKEKKSSGVTAVPLCLPLCCAMPCSIM